MAKEIKNRGASVRARLLNISKESGQNYQLVLTRYANERLLYRLAESAHADRFVLKGAVLLMTWFDEPFRGTRDIDLLGHGDPEPEAVLDVFRDIFAGEADDGVRLDAKGAQIGRIRDDTEYGGLRIKTSADIGGARVPMSVDVGFGDATEPQPALLDLLGLLDMPAVRLRGYARETVIAESPCRSTPCRSAAAGAGHASEILGTGSLIDRTWLSAESYSSSGPPPARARPGKQAS